MRTAFLLSIFVLPLVAYSHGHPVPPVEFGAVLSPISDELLRQYGHNVEERQELPNGVILHIRASSPAEESGLQSGDLLYRLDGRTITKPEDVFEIVSSSKPGNAFIAEVLRRGVRHTYHGMYGFR